MSENHGLPKGWVATSLSTVGKLYCGQSPSVSEVNHSGEGTPYVTGPEMWDGSTLKVDKWTTNPKRKVPNGCIFITVKGAGVGKLFAGVACAIGRDVYAYEPAQELSRKFVEYSLRYNISQILRHAKGDIPGLSKDHILSHLTSFPPLNEQHRIVAKIEELFSDLDAGVAALKRAKANLKRYRAAILKAAVEGKLNVESKQDSFKNANWIEIGTLLTCVEQGWSPKCEREPSSSDDEWAVMKTSAVLPMQFLAHENKRLPNSLSPETQFEVQLGDLLITRAGPRNRAAVTCLVRSSRPRLIVCDKVYRIRCNHSRVMPAYLEVALNSPPMLDELDDMKTGISDSGVNLTQQKFRRLKIPVPSLQSQRQIVDIVEERLSVAAAAEAEIEKSLLRAARLRQSILKQSFEGKLVPQDPNDESASVLLSRISTCESFARLESRIGDHRVERKIKITTVKKKV